MRSRLLIAVATLLLAGCSSAESGRSTLPQSVDAVCPYGHHAVRRVPVLHGLIPIDAALQRKIDRHEVVYGGCVDMGDHTALVCATCGFTLNDTVTPGTWVRESADPDSFQPAIGPSLQLFRRIAGKALRYRQEVYGSGAMDEGVSFLLEEPDASARMFIEQWFALAGLKPAIKRIGSGTTWWEAGPWSASLNFQASAGRPTTFVMVCHSLKEPMTRSAYQGAVESPLGSPATTSKFPPPQRDPIDALLARLAETHGMWVNGLFVPVVLPANASTDELVTRVLQQSHLSGGKVLETRRMKIPPESNATYTAALVETNLGRRIVLLQYDVAAGKWWNRVYSGSWIESRDRG